MHYDNLVPKHMYKATFYTGIFLMKYKKRGKFLLSKLKTVKFLFYTYLVRVFIQPYSLSNNKEVEQDL